MNTVLIAGIGMTPFGRFPDRGIRSMAVAAIDAGRFADEIMLALTGERGPFDSRIAFASRRVTMRPIAAASMPHAHSASRIART